MSREPSGPAASRIVMTILGIALLALPGAFPMQEDADEKAAAMARIQDHMEKREWKEAAKLLKTYQRKHASTVEERAEAGRMLRKAEGFQAYEKIQEEYRRQERVRQAVEKVQKLLEEFADVPDLVSQAEEYLSGLRSQFILLLDGFEDRLSEEEMEKLTDEEKKKLPPRMSGVGLETDKAFVKRGRKAGRWPRDKVGGTSSIPVRQNDWSGYETFCIWIYNGKVFPKEIQHLRLEFASSGGAFTTLIAIDWTGWKDVRLAMSGDQSPIARDFRATWGDVRGAWITHVDRLAHPLDLVLDDVRLEKAVK